MQFALNVVLKKTIRLVSVEHVELNHFLGMIKFYPTNRVATA
jgi:hypothetical protein